jgi:hypothetical protein
MSDVMDSTSSNSSIPVQSESRDSAKVTESCKNSQVSLRLTTVLEFIQEAFELSEKEILEVQEDLLEKVIQEKIGTEVQEIQEKLQEKLSQESIQEVQVVNPYAVSKSAPESREVIPRDEKKARIPENIPLWWCIQDPGNAKPVIRKDADVDKFLGWGWDGGFCRCGDRTHKHIRSYWRSISAAAKRLRSVRFDGIHPLQGTRSEIQSNIVSNVDVREHKSM